MTYNVNEKCYQQFQTNFAAKNKAMQQKQLHDHQSSQNLLMTQKEQQIIVLQRTCDILKQDNKTLQEKIDQSCENQLRQKDFLLKKLQQKVEAQVIDLGNLKLLSQSNETRFIQLEEQNQFSQQLILQKDQEIFELNSQLAQMRLQHTEICTEYQKFKNINQQNFIEYQLLQDTIKVQKELIRSQHNEYSGKYLSSIDLLQQGIRAIAESTFEEIDENEEFLSDCALELNDLQKQLDESDSELHRQLKYYIDMFENQRKQGITPTVEVKNAEIKLLQSQIRHLTEICSDKDEQIVGLSEKLNELQTSDSNQKENLEFAAMNIQTMTLKMEEKDRQIRQQLIEIDKLETRLSRYSCSETENIIDSLLNNHIVNADRIAVVLGQIPNKVMQEKVIRRNVGAFQDQFHNLKEQCLSQQETIERLTISFTTLTRQYTQFEQYAAFKLKELVNYSQTYSIPKFDDAKQQPDSKDYQKLLDPEELRSLQPVELKLREIEDNVAFQAALIQSMDTAMSNVDSVVKDCLKENNQCFFDIFSNFAISVRTALREILPTSPLSLPSILDEASYFLRQVQKQILEEEAKQRKAAYEEENQEIIDEAE